MLNLAPRFRIGDVVNYYGEEYQVIRYLSGVHLSGGIPTYRLQPLTDYRVVTWAYEHELDFIRSGAPQLDLIWKGLIDAL